MSLYNGPPRGGSRGGRDQFNWDAVKADKDREYYLGHSVKATTGRWQKGKDVFWYTKSKTSFQDALADEVAAVKAKEEEMMLQALGLKPRTQPITAQPKLEQHELAKLLDKREDEEEERDTVRGLGYAPGALGGIEVHERMEGTEMPPPPPPGYRPLGPPGAAAGMGTTAVLVSGSKGEDIKKRKRIEAAANAAEKKGGKKHKKHKDDKKKDKKHKRHKSKEKNDKSDKHGKQKSAKQDEPSSSEVDDDMPGSYGRPYGKLGGTVSPFQHDDCDDNGRHPRSRHDCVATGDVSHDEYDRYHQTDRDWERFRGGYQHGKEPCVNGGGLGARHDCKRGEGRRPEHGRAESRQKHGKQSSHSKERESDHGRHANQHRERLPDYGRQSAQERKERDRGRHASHDRERRSDCTRHSHRDRERDPDGTRRHSSCIRKGGAQDTQWSHKHDSPTYSDSSASDSSDGGHSLPRRRQD